MNKLVVKLTIVSTLVLLINGCATTQQTIAKVNNKYVGKNMDQFILENGMPQQKYKLNDNSYMYTWNSGTKSFVMPTTTSYSGTSTAHANVRNTGYGSVSGSAYGSSQGTATTYGGNTFNLECVIRLHATKDGNILSIKELKDSLGVWEASRCAEVLR